MQIVVEGANMLDPIALSICFVMALTADVLMYGFIPYLKRRNETHNPDRLERKNLDDQRSALTDEAVRTLSQSGDRQIEIARELGRYQERAIWLEKVSQQSPAIDSQHSAENPDGVQRVLVRIEVDSFVTTVQAHLDKLDFDDAFSLAQKLETLMESHEETIGRDLAFKALVLLADVARVKHEIAIANGAESDLTEMYKFIKKAKDDQRRAD